MARTRRRVVLMLVGITLAGLVIAFFSHPYGRQLVFGPKIRGEPLYAWQQQFRKNAVGKGDDLLSKALAWIGVQTHEFPWSNRDVELLPVLLSLREDPDPRVRKQVAAYLMWHGDLDEAIEALLHLLDDPEPDVRQSAAYAFANPDFPAKRALPDLRKRVSDEHERTRVHAAFAVWNIAKERDEEVVRVLRDGLRSSDREVRNASAEALCSMGKDVPDGHVDVVAVAKTDTGVRFMFAMCGAGYGAQAVPSLTQCLSDGNPGIRLRAVQSLGNLGSGAKEAVPAIQLLRHDSVEQIRESAADALSKIDPERYPQKKP